MFRQTRIINFIDLHLTRVRVVRDTPAWCVFPHGKVHSDGVHVGVANSWANCGTRRLALRDRKANDQLWWLRLCVNSSCRMSTARYQINPGWLIRGAPTRVQWFVYESRVGSTVPTLWIEPPQQQSTSNCCCLERGVWSTRAIPTIRFFAAVKSTIRSKCICL